jgi:hypothetical protein
MKLKLDPGDRRRPEERLVAFTRSRPPFLARSVARIALKTIRESTLPVTKMPLSNVDMGPDRSVSVGEQPIVDCGPCRARRSFLDMPHFSLAKLSFVDLRELLGSEDAAPLAEVDQL